MEINKNGCSTCCDPGQEMYEEYTDHRGICRIMYDYRDLDGSLFSCVASSLEECRKKRDEWMSKKTKKNVTLRLPQDITNWIITRSGEHNSITWGVRNIVSHIQMLERMSSNEIRNKFTPDEWLCMADSVNGWFPGDDRYRADIFAFRLEDSEQYDKTASRHNVVLSELTNKIKVLTAAQMDAVIRRIELFWQNYNLPQFDVVQWSRY